MFSLSKCKINSINGIFCILLLNLIREAAFGPIIGEIVTDISEGVFMCDQIECPAAAYRCFVSKKPNASNTQLERENICYSEDGTVLKKSLTTEQLLPGDIGAEVEINITRDGQIQVTRTGGNVGYHEIDEKQYDEQLKYIEQVRQNVENLNKNIEKSLSDIHTSISQSLSFLH